MKKFIFALFILSDIICNAQVGLKLTGKYVTNTQDSITYTAFYTIPQYCTGSNQTFDMNFPLYRSAYAAKYQPSQVLNFTGLPVLQNTVTDTSSNPTFLQLLLSDTSWLHQQGFTVITTFK